MKLYYSKKGGDDPASPMGNVGTIIIILIVIIIIVLWVSGTFGKGQQTLNGDCEKIYNGFCAQNMFSCGKDYEYEVLGKCTDKTRVCCKPKIDQSLQSDVKCQNKTKGDSCGAAVDHTYCNQLNQCVTRCEYCNKFPNDPNLCHNQKNAQGVVVEFNSNFKCQCNKATCLSKEKDGSCIQGFCEQSSPMYCCE